MHKAYENIQAMLAKEGRTASPERFKRLDTFMAAIQSANESESSAARVLRDAKSRETLGRITALHPDWGTYERKLRFVHNILNFVSQVDVLDDIDFGPSDDAASLSLDRAESLVRAASMLVLLTAWRESGDFRLADDEDDDRAVWSAVRLSVFEAAMHPEIALEANLGRALAVHEGRRPAPPMFPIFGNN